MFLTRYNEANPAKSMNLVLFDDAMKYMMRINRIIQTKRGSAMLVGVGGSGKQSLTRLAASAAEYELFQIELTRGYGKVEFLEDAPHGPDGTLKHRGVDDIELEAIVPEESSCSDCFFQPLLTKADIDPAGKPVFPVPGALAMS